MSISIKSPHQPCNVNRIWEGIASENFHIKFHATSNHSPQKAGQFQESLLEKGYPKLRIVPRKCVTILMITTVNADADVPAVHRQDHYPIIAATHKYGQICIVRFLFTEETTHGKSRTTLTNCTYIFLSMGNLEALQDEHTQMNQTNLLYIYKWHNINISNDTAALFMWTAK